MRSTWTLPLLVCCAFLPARHRYGWIHVSGKSHLLEVAIGEVPCVTIEGPAFQTTTFCCLCKATPPEQFREVAPAVVPHCPVPVGSASWPVACPQPHEKLPSRRTRPLIS